MKKSRFSQTLIIGVLKRFKAGYQVKEVCREHKVSEPTHYNWKSKYGGMQAFDVKKLEGLKEENRRLKQMFAEPSLDHKILKDVVEKKL